MAVVIAGVLLLPIAPSAKEEEPWPHPAPALEKGSLVVNSSQGGGSKDTWVLAREDEPADTLAGAAQDAEASSC